MAKQQLNARVSGLTRRQLDELTVRWGTSKTETLTVIIDRIHKEETQTMTQLTVTADQLDNIVNGPGLYVAYSSGYTAYASSDRDYNDGTLKYTIMYRNEQMPAHKTDDYLTVEQLATAMMETAPLDKWRCV